MNTTLSKKGSAYTSRFAKIMNKFSGALDIKQEPHDNEGPALLTSGIKKSLSH